MLMQHASYQAQKGVILTKAFANNRNGASLGVVFETRRTKEIAEMTYSTGLLSTKKMVIYNI